MSVTDSLNRLPVLRGLARIRAWLADSGHNALAQRVAGATFLIRIGSAALAYLSQIALARWMGAHEFGIYVYVWTWALLIGNIADAGMSSAAQRFVPEYAERGMSGHLRGFILGSRWLAAAIATAFALLALLTIRLCAPLFDHAFVIPLYLACLCLPIYAVSSVQDGIARCYNWPSVGMMPTFIARPILLLALMFAAYSTGFASDATTAMLCSVISYWFIGVGQIFLLNRRLATKIEKGPKTYEPKQWLATSLPIVMVIGFYVMLTYVDIIVLQQFSSPETVAHYHAAAKTLTLVSFVYFSVSAAAGHRFSAYQAAGEIGKLKTFIADTVRWTFWPSLALILALLAAGWPLLALFGPDFTAAYPLMFVLAFGLLARASVGPAERILSMLGEQRACAAAYFIASMVNLIACFILVPRYGAMGAAIATSLALIAESIQLFWISKKRLGFHVFVLGRKASAA